VGKFGNVITAINEGSVISHYYPSTDLHTDLGLIVYGMGIDLATVLAIMGTLWTGDPLSLDPSFSIGGRDLGVNNLLGNLGGLLGQYFCLNVAYDRPYLLFVQVNLKVLSAPTTSLKRTHPTRGTTYTSRETTTH
jgi:hypothetical protein